MIISGLEATRITISPIRGVLRVNMKVIKNIYES